MRDRDYGQIAVLLSVGGATAMALSLAAYWIGLREFGGISMHSADWGTFGDFVGGIAGTAISLVTLIAVALTLRLQSRELVAVQRAMVEQTHLTRRIEERRVRPLLKWEWRPDGSIVQLIVTNVGLGPAVIQKFYPSGARQEAHRRSRPVTKSPARYAEDVWREAIETSARSADGLALEVVPFNDQQRALPANESHCLLRVNCRDREHAFTLAAELGQGFSLRIEFESIAGEALTTETQAQFTPL